MASCWRRWWCAPTRAPGDGYFRNAARLGRDVSDPEAYWRSEVERIYDVFSLER